MIRNRTRFLLFLILSLLWMVLIYSKSAESYQQQDLRPWLRTLISEQTLLSILPHLEFTYDGGQVTFRNPYSMIEFLIRKGGHVTEYFILTALVWQALAATVWRKKVTLPLAGLIGILYAASDEWHQSFVPGRTGHAIDVYTFDTLGVLLALLISWALSRLFSWRTHRR